MKKIKCIVCDLGKVIVFFDHFIIANNIAPLCYRSPSKIFNDVVQSGFAAEYEKGTISSDEFYLKVLEIIGIEPPFLSRNDFAPLWSDIFTLNKKMYDFLKNADIRKILLSNTNEMHFEYIESKWSLSEIFDDLVLSYVERARKPEAAIFRKALEKAECRPEEILYIDDIEEYTKAFSDLGVNTITYTPKIFSEQIKEYSFSQSVEI